MRRTSGKFFGAAILVMLFAMHAAALEGMAPELYQDTVIVTGTDMRSRPAGFTRALIAVLVKVSGNPRLTTDKRAAALAAHADALVTGFDYVDPMARRRPHDDQGSYDRSYDLTVRFDPARVDAALEGLGAQPWTGPRPAIVPLIAVRGTEKPWVGTYMLTADADAGSAQRSSLANAAARYGIEVRLPTKAELVARGLWLEDLSKEGPASDPASVSIVGSIDYRPEAFGWVAKWRTRFGAVDHRSALSGVSFDTAFDRMVQEAVILGSGSAGLD